MLLRLLRNAFSSQKIIIRYFYLFPLGKNPPPQVLIPAGRGREITHPIDRISLRIYFPPQKNVSCTFNLRSVFILCLAGKTNCRSLAEIDLYNNLLLFITLLSPAVIAPPVVDGKRAAITEQKQLETVNLLSSENPM